MICAICVDPYSALDRKLSIMSSLPKLLDIFRSQSPPNNPDQIRAITQIRSNWFLESSVILSLEWQSGCKGCAMTKTQLSRQVFLKIFCQKAMDFSLAANFYFDRRLKNNWSWTEKKSRTLDFWLGLLVLFLSRIDLWQYLTDWTILTLSTYTATTY